jgi:peptidoglycan/LPS O-acetylase OafA/YrhL
VTSVLGSGNDPFQPSVIPFNVGAITCGYLAGVALVRPWRSRRTKAVVRSGSDNAYGIYLSQMLFITALAWLGWGHLTSTIPWPLLCLLTVAIVFACGIVLTSLLARTPLAVPLTGCKQQPWSTLIPRRRAAGLPTSGPGSPVRDPAPATLPAPAPATLAGLTIDQNGARP